jgi:hypothetical protein
VPSNCHRGTCTHTYAHYMNKIYADARCNWDRLQPKKVGTSFQAQAQAQAQPARCHRVPQATTPTPFVSGAVVLHTAVPASREDLTCVE